MDRVDAFKAAKISRCADFRNQDASSVFSTKKIIVMRKHCTWNSCVQCFKDVYDLKTLSFRNWKDHF